MKKIWSILIMVLLSITPGQEKEAFCAPADAPDGAIHRDQKIWRLTPPEGFGSVMAWFQVVTRKKTSSSGTVLIEYIELVEIEKGIEKTILRQDFSDEGQPLSPQRGGLYTRVPRWFDNDNHTPIGNSIIKNGVLKLSPSETPTKILHGWTERAFAHSDAKYYVKAKFKIEGDAAIQLGLDYWKDSKVGYNGWNPTCQGTNNCEGWVSRWVTDTREVFLEFKAPNN